MYSLIAPASFRKHSHLSTRLILLDYIRPVRFSGPHRCCARWAATRRETDRRSRGRRQCQDRRRRWLVCPGIPMLKIRMKCSARPTIPGSLGKIPAGIPTIRAASTEIIVTSAIAGKWKSLPFKRFYTGRHLATYHEVGCGP